MIENTPGSLTFKLTALRDRLSERLTGSFALQTSVTLIVVRIVE